MTRDTQYSNIMLVISLIQKTNTGQCLLRQTLHICRSYLIIEIFPYFISNPNYTINGPAKRISFCMLDGQICCYGLMTVDDMPRTCCSVGLKVVGDLLNYSQHIKLFGLILPEEDMHAFNFFFERKTIVKYRMKLQNFNLKQTFQLSWAGMYLCP